MKDLQEALNHAMEKINELKGSNENSNTPTPVTVGTSGPNFEDVYTF